MGDVTARAETHFRRMAVLFEKFGTTTDEALPAACDDLAEAWTHAAGDLRELSEVYRELKN